MAEYNDKDIRSIAREEMKAITAWKKGFFASLTQEDWKMLVKLSRAAEKLWQEHATKTASIRNRTRNPLHVWKQPQDKRPSTSVQDKDHLLEQEQNSRERENSTPYLRLKTAMDYWCSLWFWPIEKADKLPSRSQFLLDMSCILEGTTKTTVEQVVPEKLSLYKYMLDGLNRRLPLLGLASENNFGKVKIADMENLLPHLAIVRDLAQKYHFMHWELEFADIFKSRGGFDLVIGNPPWIKLEWNEGAFMGDYAPEYVLHKFSASKLSELRDEILKKYNIRSEYLSEFEEITGTQNYLTAAQNYPDLQGCPSNLFKCFLPQAWMIGALGGISAFVHPEGVYDDAKGGTLRQEIYKRLIYHFQFTNELSLFADVHHNTQFSLNIYRSHPKNHIDFTTIANLFDAKTISETFEHNGQGLYYGIKDEKDQWNRQGHRQRLVHIDEKQLKLLAKLYDAPGTPALEARLPAIHAEELIPVLKCFSTATLRLSSISKEYVFTEMFNETNAQKNGTIKRQTEFPTNLSSLILSGPHFYVGNPLNKTPREVCTQNSHYDCLDLEVLPDDYLPRTNYIPACDDEEFLNRTPEVSWTITEENIEKCTKVSQFYKILCRIRISISMERTLPSCIVAPRISHIDAAISFYFKETKVLLITQASFISLPFDFFIKTTGKTHFRNDTAQNLPYLKDCPQSSLLIARALYLNCLTTHYADLWEECFTSEMKKDCWLKDDPRLDNNFFKNLTENWNRNCALRSDYARRQALVEIDVLVARALGMKLEQLKLIYRVQFPVLRQNEADTWYDSKGRIVFTVSKGLVGVGLPRKKIKEETCYTVTDTDGRREGIALGWEDIKDMKSGTIERIIEDDTLPDGPVQRTITYTAPFDKCNREADYETVWKKLDQRTLPSTCLPKSVCIFCPQLS